MHAPRTMTQGEYAVHRNCSRRTVQRAISAGVIPVTEPGLRGRVLVDAADREWAPGVVKTDRPTRAGRKGAAAADRKRRGERPRDVRDPDDPSQDSDPDDLVGDALDEELVRVRIRQGRIKAAREAIELEREQRRLIPVDEVIADATQAATEIRTRLRSLGAAVAIRLACDCHGAAEVQAVIDREVNEILTVLHRARYPSAEATS